MKEVDGEPWDVAEIAGQQAQEALTEAQEAMEGLNWAARGAWMSQEFHRTKEMPAQGEFEASALGRSIQTAHAELSQSLKRAKTATLAASHDPRG